MHRLFGTPFPGIRIAAVLLVLACDGEPVLPNGDDDTAPEIESSAITLDFDTDLGTFVLAATDPDGPVAITCTGAFPGTGTDAITVERPLADVRLTPGATTTCDLEQGGVNVEHTATYGGPEDLDAAPSPVSPRPIDLMRPGAPVRLVVAGSDDWRLASYDVQWAAGETTTACAAPTGQASGTFGDAATVPGTWPAWRDTVTVEFGSTGLHCVRVTVLDDAGQASTFDSVYMVGPAEPPLLPLPSLLGEYTGRPLFEQTHVRLNLAVEEAGATIGGRWVMHYSITSASDEGTFTGTYADGILTLTLTVDAGCAGDYTLTGRALDGAGDFWTFDIVPAGGCWNYATGPLTVVRQADIAGFP